MGRRDGLGARKFMMGRNFFGVEAYLFVESLAV